VIGHVGSAQESTIIMSSRENSIADAFATFLERRFGLDPADPSFDRDTHLWQSGLLDSISLGEILIFLENEFAVKIPDYFLADERLGSINGMAAAVAKLVAAQQRSQAPGSAG
jgi:acyl carrier protein